jgi:hypothetical protein
MLGHLYEGQDCSAARALELMGERWSLLILRDALFGGCARFSEFQASLGIELGPWSHMGPTLAPPATVKITNEG